MEKSKILYLSRDYEKAGEYEIGMQCCHTLKLHLEAEDMAEAEVIGGRKRLLNAVVIFLMTERPLKKMN